MNTDLRYERWLLPFSVPFGLGPKQRLVWGLSKVKSAWKTAPCTSDSAGDFARYSPKLRTLDGSVADPQALIDSVCSDAV